MQLSFKNRLAALEALEATRETPDYVTLGPDGVMRRPDGSVWDGEQVVKVYVMDDGFDPNVA